MAYQRKTSWNSIYKGVEIDCDDVHIIVSSLPTRSAKLDEILRIEASGSGWRLPTEKDAKMVCITGSNGKTTTTSLIYHIFNAPQ